ncbi:MAG: alpha/beta hydrolase [Abitibacteriaceae bacterium]|nr:alpha/beta hydrolase [Abditibacteriaceae bacterium]
MKYNSTLIEADHDTPGELALAKDCNGHGAGTWGALKTVAKITGVALGAMAATNAIISLRTPPLDNELGGTFNRYPTRHGDLAYTVSGTGSPVLLLHGLGAGNSMMEWEHNFRALAQQHTVYALDFIGWGLSDKPDEPCWAEEFIEQVQYFVEDIIAEPCAVIASSQSCAFAVEAARRAPKLIQKLILVCPAEQASAGKAMAFEWPQEMIYRLLRWPVVGAAFYNFIASRQNIQRFACHQLYFDKSRVDESLVRRYHVAAHQNGSKYGLSWLLGGLLDIDWRESWSRLEIPALLVWGRNAMLNGLDTAPEWLALKPDARLSIIDEAMLLPHVEHPQQFNELVLKCLAE